MGFWNDAWRVVKGVPETIGELGKSLFVKDLDAITNVSNLGNSLDSRAKTYVIIHGYQNTSAEPWVNDMAAKLHQKDSSANVLALNWLYNGSDDGYSASNMEYNTAASRVVNAGEKLAHYLKDKGIDPANVTIIGHSLGAHVAAYAGKETKEITGKSLSEIIGLDPAGPGFDHMNPIGSAYHTSLREGLNPSSADKVIAIHSSVIWGNSQRLGTKDIYLDDWYPQKEEVSLGNFKDLMEKHIDKHSNSHRFFAGLLEGKIYQQSDGSKFDEKSLYESRDSIGVSTTDPYVPNPNVTDPYEYDYDYDRAHEFDSLVSDGSMLDSYQDQTDSLLQGDRSSKSIFHEQADPLLNGGTGNYAFRNIDFGDVLTNPGNGNSDASKIEAIRNADIMGMNNGFEFGSDRLSISNSWGTNNDSPISNSWGMVSGVSDSNFGTQRNPLENTDSAYGLIKTDDFVTAEQRQLQAV
jgi:pimeloyl-ACP methyl ester carboxylesterase